MSFTGTAVAPAVKTQKGMRIGLILRLLALAALVTVVAINGAALKTRAFEGKSYHYTVFAEPGSDVGALSADLAGQKDFKVEHVVTDGATQAFGASMPVDRADQIRSDPRVAFIELDSVKTVQHNWWDTAMITLGMRTPHF